MTIPDVAQELTVSESQVRVLLKSGDLPAIQIGGRGQWRIARSKLEDYISDAYTRMAETNPPRGAHRRRRALAWVFRSRLRSNCMRFCYLAYANG